MLRTQALGRRTWTFLGSDRDGRMAAVLYSFTGACKYHDIDPRHAYAFSRAREIKSVERTGSGRLIRC
jgi:hypothetical protein